MASPRFSVIAVVAGVLAAAGAGAYYFFAVFSSDEKLREARAQVETWEKEWVELRHCVLGLHPMAASFEDAITGRELSEGSAAAVMGDCSKQVGKLTRPAGNSTGIDEVEETWLQIDELAGDLAQRYVKHLLAPLTDVGEQSFAAGLTQMAKVRAALRGHVKLPTADEDMGPAPRELALVELAVEGKKLTKLDVQAATASGELLGRATAGESALLARISRAGAAVAIEGKPLAADVVTPLPSTASGLPGVTWGVVADEDDSGEVPKGQLFASALDAQGAVAMTGAPLASGPWVRLDSALGDGPGRLVVYRNDQLLMLAVSDDAGATWRRGATAPSGDAYAFPGDGFVDLLAMEAASDRDPYRTISSRRILATTLPTIPPASTVHGYQLRRACAAPSGPWALVADQRDSGGALYALRFAAAKLTGGENDETAVAPMAVPDPEAYDFVECDDAGALLGTGSGGPLWSCRSGKEECTRFPWRATSGLGTVVAGAPLVVTVRRQLLAVLTEENPPLLLRLPPDTQLRSLHGLAGAPLVVLQRKDGTLAAATLPVK